MRVLVTGGLGYIGSHASIELALRKHDLLILDNLENSTLGVLDVIRQFTDSDVDFERIDIRDSERLDDAIAGFMPDAIVHFAAKKDPQESILKPTEYYDANVLGTINLAKAARKHLVRKFVFSSSAAVYGHAKEAPVNEDHPLEPLSPYARTKQIGEMIVADIFASQSGACAFALRYFNPVGTHQSGALLAHHQKSSNNLFPALMRAVRSDTDVLTVHGSDLPTPDGTGVRDYIHVQDLAVGHVAALHRLGDRSGMQVLNLGTGQGYSVRQVIDTFEETLGRKVRHEYGPARPGDPAVSYAATERSVAALAWSPGFNLEQMLQDEWLAFYGSPPERQER